MTHFMSSDARNGQKNAVWAGHWFQGLRGVCGLNVGISSEPPQNVGHESVPCQIDGASTSHYSDFGLQAFGKKRFLPMILKREMVFAPSWGLGFPRPCSKRGRQEKWYKDFWLLHSQRFSRLWLYRAVRTVLRYKLLRIWPCYRLSQLTGLCPNTQCRGRGLAPVRHAPFPKGCV